MQARIGRVVPGVVGLVVAGLAVRLWLRHFVPVIETDGAVYGRLAQEILTGTGERGFHPAWPPLYPHLIAAFARLLHPALPPTLEGLARPDRVEDAARVANCVVGALLVPLLYLIAHRIAGWKAGLAAACLGAFHPRLLEMSVQALTEMPFAFACTLCLLGLGALAKGSADVGRRRAAHAAAWAALAGLAGGLAYLTRPEGIVLLPIGLAALLLGRGIPSRPALAALFAGLFLVLAAPHVARVSGTVGYFSIGSKSDYNLLAAYAGAPGVPVIDRSRSQYNNFPSPAESLAFSPEPVPHFPLARFALEHPGTVAGHFLRQVPHSVGALPSLAYFPFVLLALAGIGLPRRRAGEETVWLLFWVALVGLYAGVFVYRRFFSGVLPLLLIEAAFGLWRLCRGRGVILAAASAAAIVYGVLTAAGNLKSESYPVEQRALAPAAVAAVKADRNSNDPPSLREGGGLMARKPFAAYYAGLAIIAFAEDAPADVLREASARGARLVLVDERDLVREKPAFRDLLDSTSRHDGLNAISSTGREPFRAVLYRVRSDSIPVPP